MKIDHEFAVPAPADRTWAVLTDIEQVATCMPGAQLTGFADGSWTGSVKVKVGPVTAAYGGSAAFVEKDDAGHHAVISARGKESRGAGTASATIDMRLRPDGERTVVTVGTDLKISGKIAQFGAGMIQEVSAKLLGQFVECLAGRLSAEPEPAEPEPAEPAAEPAAQPAPQPAPRPVAGPEPAAVDLVGVAGMAVLKRLAPVLVAAVLLAVILRRRRR